MCIGLEATQVTQPAGDRARSIQIPQFHGLPVFCRQRFRKMERRGCEGCNSSAAFPSGGVGGLFSQLNPRAVGTLGVSEDRVNGKAAGR